MLMWILWQVVDERRYSYRFVYTIPVLNLSALTTFICARNSLRIGGRFVKLATGLELIEVFQDEKNEFC